MALPDLDTYLARVQTGQQRAFRKLWTGIGQPLRSHWMDDPDGAPAAPTTPVTCDYSTPGAFAFRFSGQRVLLLDAMRNFTVPGQYPTVDIDSGMNLLVFCDRLSHQAGLTKAPGVQTTNLPTAALTRYTTGAGVMIGIETYSAGSSSLYAQVTYTNSAGVGGQVSQPSVLTNGFNWSLVSLADGDTGVRSVESFEVLSGTSAGNLGITLFKPLFWVPVLAPPNFWPGCVLDAMGMGLNLPAIAADACLFAYSIGNSSGSGSAGFTATLTIGAD